MKTKIIATTCAVAVILSTASAGAEWRQLTQNRIIVSGEIDNGQGTFFVISNKSILVSIFFIQFVDFAIFIPEKDCCVGWLKLFLICI